MIKKKTAGAKLVPGYTFENFIHGKANKLPYEACLSMATRLDATYSPIFICGGVGTGKTHLLQAIGNKVIERFPKVKVFYYTSLGFMEEFIDHVSRQSMPKFRRNLENVDVLLIDDVHEWEGKERTQGEFFHLFNALHESRKLMAFAGNKPPGEIEGLHKNLMSRFKAGTVFRLRKPGATLLREILRNSSMAEGITLPEDVLSWLVSMKGAGVREGEGCLKRIIAESEFAGKKITLGMSKKALNGILKG